MRIDLSARTARPPSEKVIQRAVIALFRAAGFTVRSTSQVRPSMVALGLPDLLIHHVRKGLFAWFETKRPGARLGPEQEAFRRDAVACGQRHYWGDRQAAELALVDMGCAHYCDRQFWLGMP